jgi:cytidylate kinase
MSATPGLEQCLTFINSQLKPGGRTRHTENGPQWRAITLSREAGCGAAAVAGQLRDLLQVRAAKDGPPWTVFDRNLLERVLADHHLPQRLAAFMPEARASLIEDAVEELFGLHPASSVLVRQTAETVLQLAELGNVILIGRGANIITRRLPHVFHVRLVGALESRLARVQAAAGGDRKTALQLLLKRDRDRAGYLKQYFNANIADPLNYHLTINTELIPGETAAGIISEAMQQSRITTQQ